MGYINNESKNLAKLYEDEATVSIPIALYRHFRRQFLDTRSPSPLHLSISQFLPSCARNGDIKIIILYAWKPSKEEKQIGWSLFLPISQGAND